MTSDLIEQLRIPQYESLLGSGCGCETKIKVFDADPEFVSAAIEKNRAESDESITASLLSKSEWQPLCGGVEQYTGELGYTVLRLFIQLGSEEKDYWLTATFPRTHEVKCDVSLRATATCMVQIAALMTEDHNLNLTLEGMAQELAIRYEELNVIYGLEELTFVEGGSFLNESSSLAKLIDNCLDYLPVDLVAIIVPTDGILVSNMENMSSHLNADSIIEFMSTEILSRVRENGETLVVNQDAVTDWANIDTDLPVKFIASPIISLNQEVVGIFVFTNFLNRPDFTNSDRKLADVFSVEISNIIKSKRDPLTGLLSRHGLDNAISEFIDKGKCVNTDSYIMYLDIDQFAAVNDTSGFSTGDKLLQQFAEVLKSLFKESTVLARIGTDEFALLLHGMNEESIVEEARRIQQCLKEIHYFSGKKSFEINMSIGIARFSSQQEDVSRILQDAQVACQASKHKGGDRVRVFDSNDEDLAKYQEIARSAEQISDALKTDRFVLFAQAIVASDSGKDDEGHYEVLVRMLDEEGKPVPPGLFIPAAERYRMMAKLDELVINKAVAMLSECNRLRNDQNFSLAINLSGQSIGDDRFTQFVFEKVTKSDIHPGQICFEITETAAISNLAVALKFIKRIRALGCKFALDDFGAGMSSFNYLKHLPIDYLKIDGQFVKNMLEHHVDATMVEAMNNIGHVMNLRTIAEFVENAEIGSALAEIGVDYLQGYGLHKPEPLEDILALNACGRSSADIAG